MPHKFGLQRKILIKLTKIRTGFVAQIKAQIVKHRKG